MTYQPINMQSGCIVEVGITLRSRTVGQSFSNSHCDTRTRGENQKINHAFGLARYKQ